MRTPLDPRTGATEVAFGPLELIHALAQQIPDKGQHLVRYYAAYSNRARRFYRAAEKEEGGRGGREDPRDAESEYARERRRSWARLLRKVLELDPLLCPKCRGEHLLAFSCRTRNFCPRCQAKRAALLSSTSRRSSRR